MAYLLTSWLNNIQKKFQGPTRPGNTGTCHAHFLAKFLQGKFVKLPF